MRKGEVMSEEQKDKIRQSNLGKKHNISREGFLNLRLFKKGEPSWNKGVPMPAEAREKLKLVNIGKKHNQITILKMKLSARNAEENHKWKGDDVGYYGLHMWIKRHFGTPTTCEFCGKSNLEGKQINWANKSHNYRREREDWLRLCARCHKNYDKSFAVC